MVDVQEEDQNENPRLDQAEGLLGDHVTGGVILSWRQVQKRLSEVLPEGKPLSVLTEKVWSWKYNQYVACLDCAGLAGVDTDHDKLLAQLVTELKESQQLVRLQQQLLQV